jgi:hypothetical protein
LVCSTCLHLERWHEQRLHCITVGCACTRFKPASGNKRNAVRVGGYASKLEHQRACELRTLQAGGAIANLGEQVVVNVAPDGCEAIMWRIDFRYEDNGKTVYEDAKGIEDDAFRIKAKLFRWKYPDNPLLLSIRGRGRSIEIHDTRRSA